MSLREIYEAVLMELHKAHAPNITLETFNYLARKAVYQYMNKKYNIYDTNQQTTDDLGVLKGTAILPVYKMNNYQELGDQLGDLLRATYAVQLPEDYYHILSCICFYDVAATFQCHPKGKTFRAKATRLTADAWSEVVDNFWNKPNYNRPYYYINNVNTNLSVPTQPYNSSVGELNNIGKDAFISFDYNFYEIKNVTTEDININYYLKLQGNKIFIKDSNNNTVVSDKPILIKITNGLLSGYTNNTLYKVTLSQDDGSIESSETYSDNGTQEDPTEMNDPFKKINVHGFMSSNDTVHPQKIAQVRYGNASKILMEIRYGTDDSIFKLKNVLIDYIKTPQYLNLTQEQIDRTLDTSQIMEFPDYVCQQIINELVILIMENLTEERVQTFPVVTQSIASPVQQQTDSK